MKKIFLSLTTITPGAWREKIAEAKKLELREIALFLTCLNPPAKQELYESLKKTKIEKIPFVHLRSDMALQEMEDSLTIQLKAREYLSQLLEFV
jgi:hypothetical protein